MKKIISVLLIITMIAALSAALIACTPREEVLKLYMPGEYIDEDIFEEFEAWYSEQTGKNVKVKIKTFDSVEAVQRQVEVRKADYDLLCPSDYMIEYLVKNELVQKVDKTVIDIAADGLFKEQYLETTKTFDPTLEYAVPYMYGTLGIVYDITKTNKKITSWESLYGDEFDGHRSIKDSIRDAYASVCLYNAASSLKDLEGKAKKEAVQAVFEDTSAATVAKAKETLLPLTESDSAVWDVDNVKFDMAAAGSASSKKSASSDVAVALMWSCDAGYVMNNYEDANGKEHEGNRNLWYVVPEEGGNVYIDAFVISKYAVNTEAANYFLKFLCLKDTAMKNSVYAGAVSPVAAAYDALYEEYNDPENEMLKGVDAEWRAMFLETMFPSETTLDRCGVMRDFGKEGQKAVADMWSSIQ
ncbi:MAG: ABC transporter substrate-binding protein [Clostridia bacterium]|nr:ABC transporter substrate-binding protein [Clostridia bacterium]